MIADHLDEVVFKNLADDNQESIRVTGCGVFMPKGIVSISYWRTIDKTATGYGVFILAFCNAGLILCVFLYLKEGHTFVIRQAVIRNLPEEVRVVCHAEELSNMQAMDLMSAAINDVVCAMDAIDKFAEAFGLCEDQEAEREKDLKILIDAVCEQEPGIPKCTVDRVIRTAFDLLEDDEEEDEDDE